MASKAPAPPASSYWTTTSDLANALVLVLPLFVGYQVGVLATGGVRNGVDFLTDLLLFAARAVATLGLGDDATDASVLWVYVGGNLALLVLGLVAIRFLPRQRGLRASTFGWLWLETSVYALLFSSVVTGLMRLVGLDFLLAIAPGSVDGLSIGPAWAPSNIALAAGLESQGLVGRVVISLGAGLYEETVFRLGLLSALVWGLRRGLGQSEVRSVVVAVVVSSVVFSAVHHIGALGDPFAWGVFLYRSFAGAVFAALFYARGFAVVVYTHALYDVLVLVFRA